MLELLGNLRLENWYLAGVGSIFLMIILWKISTRKQNENFGDMQLIQEIYGKHAGLYRVFQASLVLISLGYILLLGNIYLSGSVERIKKDGIDIVMVFDISYSMAAKDIKPSRLEAAKNLFGELAGELAQDRIGLVLFAGKSFQSVPLSYDHNFLQKIIDDINLDILPQNIGQLQGTAIGDGLLMAANILTKDDNPREKVIILLSDGEANSGVDPSLALGYLQEKNIRSYTIGLGKDENTTLEIPGPMGFPQKLQVGGLDEVLLKTIAEKTGGLYYRVDSDQELTEVSKSIGELEKSPLETEVFLSKKYLKKELSLILVTLFFIVGYIVWYKKIITPLGNRN